MPRKLRTLWRQWRCKHDAGVYESTHEATYLFGLISDGKFACTRCCLCHKVRGTDCPGPR